MYLQKVIRRKTDPQHWRVHSTSYFPVNVNVPSKSNKQKNGSATLVSTLDGLLHRNPQS
jgi:hypothetical protein